MRNCATESFLTDPPTEEVRNIVNKGQRDFSVNIIKSLFDKYHKGSCSSNRICVLFLTYRFCYLEIKFRPHLIFLSQ